MQGCRGAARWMGGALERGERLSGERDGKRENAWVFDFLLIHRTLLKV